jgi:tetratricopeptide (TPR) repeat protein
MYAEAQRNLKEWGSAKNHLDRAVELAPAQAQLWYAMLIIAWEGEDWKTLKRALDALKHLDGEGDIIRRFSALYEAKTSADDKTTITLLQDAIRALGPEPELMYALGERYLKTGLIDQSIIWFEKTISLEAGHERAHLGDIAALEALFKEGEKGMQKRLDGAYKRYLARWPDNHALHREWALFLIHNNEFKRAVPELEALLPREPANPTLRRLLAYGYRKTGRFREAAVFLKALLKESPRDTALLIEFTGCLARSGSVYYAVMVLDKALHFINDSADIPLALGLLHYREGRIEKAFDMLREARSRNSADPRPYHWMAFISRRRGDVQGAERYEREERKRIRPGGASFPRQ